MGIAINPYQTTSIMERERFFSWLNLFHIQMSHTNSGQPHPSILKNSFKRREKIRSVSNVCWNWQQFVSKGCWLEIIRCRLYDQIKPLSISLWTKGTIIPMKLNCLGIFGGRKKSLSPHHTEGWPNKRGSSARWQLPSSLPSLKHKRRVGRITTPKCQIDMEPALPWCQRAHPGPPQCDVSFQETAKVPKQRVVELLTIIVPS